MEEVADCIEAGILRALPGAKITKAPMVDGGEDFTRALVEATGGTLHPLVVTGPVVEPVEAHFGFLGGVRDGPRTVVPSDSKVSLGRYVRPGSAVRARPTQSEYEPFALSFGIRPKTARDNVPTTFGTFILWSDRGLLGSMSGGKGRWRRRGG